MTKHGLDACGGGGWTLVMKIDGTKVLIMVIELSGGQFGLKSYA